MLGFALTFTAALGSGLWEPSPLALLISSLVHRSES
jgi:hypothetical protein